ncbi:hypothetical protein A3Q56_00044 [Intoshia linei]|uniref:Uncharacterized protein n=1 Tax=Intoshia linei TaxID=1819745 RepID=A0A177BD72_9BILA|nr:hypothetical protein A3Q56_00044 [Intoshia linei]
MINKSSIIDYDFSNKQFVSSDMLYILKNIEMNKVSELKKNVTRQNVNTVDKFKRTPIYWALYHTNLDCLKVILSKSCNIEHTDMFGFKPIHYAAWSANPIILSELLNHGADLFSKTKNGLTVLHAATSGENLLNVKFLLDSGNYDKIYIKNKKGETPLMMSVMNKTNCISTLILSKIPEALYEIDQNRESIFHLISKTDNYTLLESILDKIESKKQISALNKNFETPLQVAVRNESENVFDFLIKIINPNTFSKDGKTPLCDALMSGNLKFINGLLENGADMNLVDITTKYSAIHVVAKYSTLDVMILLLSHNADINKVNKSKETALHLACSNGNVDIARYLLTENINYNLRDVNGRIALDLALRDDYIYISNLIIAEPIARMKRKMYKSDKKIEFINTFPIGIQRIFWSKICKKLKPKHVIELAEYFGIKHELISNIP